MVSADVNILTSLMANTNPQYKAGCIALVVESRLLTSGHKIAAIFAQCSSWKTEGLLKQLQIQSYDPENALKGQIAETRASLLRMKVWESSNIRETRLLLLF